MFSCFDRQQDQPADDRSLMMLSLARRAPPGRRKPGAYTRGSASSLSLIHFPALSCLPSKVFFQSVAELHRFSKPSGTICKHAPQLYCNHDDAHHARQPPRARARDADVEDRADRAGRQGRAVQVEQMKSTLNAPGTQRLKLKHENLLSSFWCRGVPSWTVHLSSLWRVQMEILFMLCDH